MVKLLPCPFCGGAPESFPSGDDTGTMIECMTPGCVNPHVSYYGDGVAAKVWNRRLVEEAGPVGGCLGSSAEEADTDRATEGAVLASVEAAVAITLKDEYAVGDPEGVTEIAKAAIRAASLSEMSQWTLADLEALLSRMGSARCSAVGAEGYLKRIRATEAAKQGAANVTECLGDAATVIGTLRWMLHDRQRAAAGPELRDSLARIIDPAAFAEVGNVYLAEAFGRRPAARGRALAKADAVLELIAAARAKEAGE
jgi:hypothetical protein